MRVTSTPPPPMKKEEKPKLDRELLDPKVTLDIDAKSDSDMVAPTTQLDLLVEIPECLLHAIGFGQHRIPDCTDGRGGNLLIARGQVFGLSHLPLRPPPTLPPAANATRG